MKKILSYVVTFALLIGCLVYPQESMQAANVSMGINKSTFKIGETVTVTLTVPDEVASAGVDIGYQSNMLTFTGATPGESGYNGNTISVGIGKHSVSGSNKVTLTFTAKTSGTATITADVYTAVIGDEEVELGGASASITIENEVEAPDDPQDEKSSDNSLSSLKLSHGKLSPAFRQNVTKYTATVGYDISSLVVSAKTTSSKAVIESVTGNGTVALQVGENKIQIVVRAENGVKSTYTIVVTRQSEGDSQKPDESESESESETESPSVNDILQWNGEVLTPAENIPDSMVPADFQKITIAINSVEMPCLQFANGNLKVLYLYSSEEEGGFYIYDEAQQCIYPFVRLSAENAYIFVLRSDDVSAPEHYESCTLSIEGKGVVNAYQPEQASEFYLIYAMNKTGATGWYVYDSVEGTFQRYQGMSAPSVEGNEDDTQVVAGDLAPTEQKQLEQAKLMMWIILGIAVVIIVILLIIIIRLTLKKQETYYDEYEDEEDSYYEEDSEDDFNAEDFNAEDSNTEDSKEEDFYPENLLKNESDEENEPEDDTKDDKEDEIDMEEDDDLEFIDLD